MDTQSADYRRAVREHNDLFRCSGVGQGSVVLTSGIHDRGPSFVSAALAAVQTFTAFDRDNDPYHEHDFGAFTLEGKRLFFKIDYYNLTLDGHSPDAADPAVTHRVLTVMLASEY